MINLALASELTFFAGAGFSTLYLTLKNRQPESFTLPATGNETARLLNLQSRYGYNPHSLVSVSETNRTWFDLPTQSCAAYTEHGKVWLAAGDIIAAAENLREATENFFAAAKKQNRIAAFMPVTERFARAAVSERIKAVKIGASPYFDLQNWNPRGNRAKHLRANLNQGKRAGISITAVSKIDEKFKLEVEQLCKSWLATRCAAVKFGWLFGLSPFQLAEHKRFFAARDKDGALIGLLAASPIPAREGWYLEDILRSSNAPNGTTDLLICEAFRTFAAEGAKLATLGTVPLATEGEDTLSTDGNILTKHTLKFSRSHFRAIYGFEGLRRFKARFVPTWWESEYVLAPRGLFVAPKIVNAFRHAILPNGLLNLAKHQIIRAVANR